MEEPQLCKLVNGLIKYTYAHAGKQIARQLTDADDVLQHNAWDDVAMTPDEEAEAEALVGSQSIAGESVADGCRRDAAMRWDKHYDENPRSTSHVFKNVHWRAL